MSITFFMTTATAATPTVSIPVNSVTRKCCTCGSFSHKTR